MKRIYLVMALLLAGGSGTAAYGQVFTATKKKINLTGESYGLGIDNFGVMDTTGKEIKDIRDIYYGDRITIAFYNVSGFLVMQDLAHLRMTMSIADLTGNKVMIASETLLDEKIPAEKLKNEYMTSYLSITDGFEKGKNYLIRVHLWDVNSGESCDLIWRFRANFRTRPAK